MLDFGSILPRLLRIVGLLAVIPAFVCAEVQWSQPRQSVELPVGATEHVATYAFTNAGDQPATIIDVHVDCDCTTAAIHPLTYAHGESGELKLTLDTRGLEGEVERELLVKLRYGDGTSATVKNVALQLHASITPWFTFSPRVLFWSADETAAPRTLTVTLSATEHDDAQLVLGDIPADLNAELSATGPRTYQLTARPATPSDPGEWHLPLELHAADGSLLTTASVYVLVR
ncbi:DUF1573 domain-containing protein [Actomonas aquatica]|uniref:DUF1573 domain-containing protein n=1 Tax=Actomonas aquatica TaxID=2866162 RepID=A0ABZ1CDS4_9BACT|nr:DUF1573 domain-containing protein [Opitutus sp. WL0086]WRQ89832.1 DUF1573 domain-containing protein [Opitutus sp. WL0086]